MAVGLIAIGFVSFLAVRSLSQVDWDPTLYTAFGEDATPTRDYAEDRLGDVYLRAAQGHDGKFFFVQANDPWIVNPDENAQVLDRPLYRSQRMLYPVLAGGFGIFSPETIVWTMIVVNILAFGFGSFATAELARTMNMSPWWGLAFTLNIGLVSELNIDGAGIVAAAAAFGAIALFQRDKPWWAIGLLVAAVLSREAMLIVAAGSAFWMWRYKRDRRLALLSFGVPVAAVGLWALYLRWRIGWEAGVSEVQEIGIPFVGFGEALSGWLDAPSLDLAVGLVIMALFVAFTLRVIASRRLVGWAFVGFVLLGIVFTKQVWSSYFDISRAVAPVITAYVLLLFAGRAEPVKQTA